MTFFLHAVNIFFRETIVDVLFFPVWWYSRGLLIVLKRLRVSIVDREAALGLRIWISSLGKPMYGQRDWQSRMISFALRLIVLFFRSIFFLLWIILCFALLAAYLFSPIIVVIGILNS